MDCFVMIDDGAFKGLHDKDCYPVERTSVPTRNGQLDLTSSEAKVDDWVVLVYEEPGRRGDYINYYIYRIAQRIKNHTPNEVMVFFHFTNVLQDAPGDTVSQQRYDYLAENLRGHSGVSNDVQVQVWGYHRIAGVWDDILKHLPERMHDPQSFDSFIKEIKEKLQGEEEKKNKLLLTILKHRIDHIFLPTVIDLQGISDELKENRKDLADDYLKEVFEMRINSDFEKDKIGEGYTYYRNRLNRARYLAVGHQDANTKKALRLVALEDVEEQELKTWIASGQPEAQLPDEGKAMCDLVHEAMRDLVQETLKSQWERFIKLLGLCQVDDNTFKCNSTSPIQQFMHKMDCWLKEYPKLPEPNEVLGFFKQFQDWGIESVTIRSFGDWFSELVDAMDKLRDSLK